MEISGQNLTLDQLVAVSKGGVKVQLAGSARKAVTESRAYIDGRIARGDVMYGVNTGFGAFSSVRISDAEINELQQNLIRSHSVGVGDSFSPEETRAIMLLRANALARGHSGVRAEVVDKILEFLNADCLPVIPSQGSVGASGDLAPLSHLALGLIGEGQMWSDGRAVETKDVLAKKNVKPLELRAKEGLSLINGCQVMTAVGGLAAHRARSLAKIGDVAGALSLEALRGSRGPFHPLISDTRPHGGEKRTARNMLRILDESSPIAKSHENCGRVQDAYSLRCIPAVHGAVKDSLRTAWGTLETEANSSTDNPLVFVKDDVVLSCGNFHGEPVAFQLDFLAIAFAALGSISECRISKLINPAFSELPAFLTAKGGLNSGMMIVQVAAAALVSENKIHSHPASVDSIPTSVDKEDHVSMGTIAARKYKKVIENIENVLAMEFLCNLTALRFLEPLTPAGGAKAAFDLLKKHVPPIEKDRVFAKDIQNIRELIVNGTLLNAVESAVGELEW